MDAMRSGKGGKVTGAVMTYSGSVALAVGCSFLTVWLTRAQVKQYEQSLAWPPFFLPMEIFPIIWGALHLLMGISAARIYRKPNSQMKKYTLKTYIWQLIFHFFWVIWLFDFRWYEFAFLWLLMLWVQVTWMIAAFHQMDLLATWLQIPYMIWMPVAAYLNFGIMVLND